ncbi:unnamed protein product [Urochloa humidicola]
MTFGLPIPSCRSLPACDNPKGGKSGGCISQRRQKRWQRPIAPFPFSAEQSMWRSHRRRCVFSPLLEQRHVFRLFYVMAELYGSIVISVLF